MNPSDPSSSSSSSSSTSTEFSQLNFLLSSADPLRFTLELEFLELLANPFYLQHLAQQRYLFDSTFLNYLDYLRYWKQPQYIRYISHPHCLYFLDLLQENEFREALLKPDFVNLIHSQQYWHWRSYRYNRYMEYVQEEEKLSQEERNKQQQQQQIQIQQQQQQISQSQQPSPLPPIPPR